MQLSILQTLPTVLKKPRDISKNTNANARPNACKVKINVRPLPCMEYWKAQILCTHISNYAFFCTYWTCAPLLKLHYSGLLMIHGKKAKFCRIFRGKFTEKSADLAGF